MNKTPLKNRLNPSKSLNTVLSKIPVGSVVDTFVLFDGEYEIALSEYDRFVCAHTNKYAVFEFWHTLQRSPQRMYKILTSNSFRFHPKMYSILQEKWIAFKDPVIRSCLFFMLNQSSNTGMITSGVLETRQLDPVALSDIKSFKNKSTFNIIFDTDIELSDSISSELKGDYIFLSPGKFSYNFFEEGKSQSHDTTSIDHQKLKEALIESGKKFVLVYHYDKRVSKFYKKFNHTLIDKYGRIVESPAEATEVVIANF